MKLVRKKQILKKSLKKINYDNYYDKKENGMKRTIRV